MTKGGGIMGSSKAVDRVRARTVHVQMELAFNPPGTLRHALDAYLAHRAEGGCAEMTISDYGERSRWLLRVLGENTPLVNITYLRLERLAREHGIHSGQREFGNPYYGKRGALMNVTLAKRLRYLRGAMKYSVMCGWLHRDSIPELPKLKDDGIARRSFHTVSQWRDFRQELRPGSMRRFADLGMWTGHHTLDLEATTWEMLDPERPIVNEDGDVIGVGMFLRRNHKNKRCYDVWFPMEPEFRTVVRAWYAEGLAIAPDAKVCGKVWAKNSSFAVACERAGVPRVSPIDLRRSYASTLIGRGYSHEYVRQALGHEGETSLTSGSSESANPSTLSRHYLHAGPALWNSWEKLHGNRLPTNDNAAK